MSSVAVIVLDTLRYDAFSDAFDWLDGIRFSRAYSTAHWTIPAHASLFTGRYPSELGVHGRAPTLDCPDRTLAEAFNQADRSTQCLTANTQLTQYEGWDRGFDSFDGPANLARSDDGIFDWEAHIAGTEPGFERVASGIWGCLTGDCDAIRSLRYGYRLHRTPKWDGGAGAILRRLRRSPMQDVDFLMVNIMETHTPYHPPPGGTEPVSVLIADALAEDVSNPEEIKSAYQVSVEYLSDVYRDIVRELAEDFEYVVTLSDHGEYLGEHGLWNHSVGLHPELIHIPLMISGPDLDSRTVTEPVNMLDVHRTIADLGNVPVTSGGRNLFGSLEPKPLLFESHGLLPFHKSQFERTGAPLDAFRRWQTPLSGYVSEDGAYCYHSEPGAFRVLGETNTTDPEAELSTLFGALDKRQVDEEDIAVSEDTMKRLEELGYA